MKALVGIVLAWAMEGIPAPDQEMEARLPAVEEQLAHMTLTLVGDGEPRFVLAYHGEPMPFEGLVCYGFAGYNETCLAPKIGRLTTATRIELPAPGGVPREFLVGYEALVRFPSLSPKTYRYSTRGP